MDRDELPTPSQTGLIVAIAAVIVLGFIFVKSCGSFDEEITQCMAEPDQTLQSCVEAHAERFSPP
jgi:hypothetical protein